MTAALKDLLGVPAPAPEQPDGSVWAGAPKVAKSLREIQEEEAAREAEQQAKLAAATGKAAIAAASPWAKAAAKGASKVDAKPVVSSTPAAGGVVKKSLREIQVRWFVVTDAHTCTRVVPFRSFWGNAHCSTGTVVWVLQLHCCVVLGCRLFRRRRRKTPQQPPLPSSLGRSTCQVPGRREQLRSLLLPSQRRRPLWLLALRRAVQRPGTNHCVLAHHYLYDSTLLVHPPRGPCFFRHFDRVVALWLCSELFWDYTEAPVAAASTPSPASAASAAKTVAAASVVKASAHLGPPPAKSTPTAAKATAKPAAAAKPAPAPAPAPAPVAQVSHVVEASAADESTGPSAGNEFGGGVMSAELAKYVCVLHVNSFSLTAWVRHCGVYDAVFCYLL